MFNFDLVFRFIYAVVALLVGIIVALAMALFGFGWAVCLLSMSAISMIIYAALRGFEQ